MNVVCKEKATAIYLNITKITPLQKSAFVNFITTNASLLFVLLLCMFLKNSGDPNFVCQTLHF